MRDELSRLVGIDGVVVTGVVEVGRQLEIEVELVTEVACCRWCGRASLGVKDRPVVRIRDLSIAGRVTFLRWRKRRYWCEACERRFTETHPALPSRQRVSALSPGLAAVAVVLGAAVTSLAGLVHFSPAHPHVYFVAVYAVAGIGAGVASTLCRRDRQVVLIGIGIGVVAGALGGVMRPLKYAADPTSPWIAANVLATVISTAPLCLFIGIWPREPDSVSTHSVAAGKPNR